MKREKRLRLEAAGWKVGSTEEFLGLTDEEAALVAVRAGLAEALRDARRERRWTQAHLAEIIGSSQSRVAKMEAADRSVSIDLLVRSLLVSGVSGETIAAPFAALAASARRAARRDGLEPADVPEAIRKVRRGR